MFRKRVEIKKDFLILRIRSDKGDEFNNHSFITYYKEHGIKHELSCLRTPLQNGVIKSKNRTLQEMVRTMINEYRLSQTYGSRP